MTIDLSNQVVAVTGASSGIGEATALACARAGAGVALAARREDRIQSLAERIVDEGGRAIAVATDVGEEQQATELPRAPRGRRGSSGGEWTHLARSLPAALSRVTPCRAFSLRAGAGRC
jgi:NAD(P)-dependent dehydrogenase (short-subunit alcohol dehydrogenase family)